MEPKFITKSQLERYKSMLKSAYNGGENRHSPIIEAMIEEIDADLVRIASERIPVSDLPTLEEIEALVDEFRKFSGATEGRVRLWSKIVRSFVEWILRIRRNRKARVQRRIERAKDRALKRAIGKK